MARDFTPKDFTPKVEFYRKLSLRSLKMEWRWRVTAANGKRIGASTEGYIDKLDCESNATRCGILLRNTTFTTVK